MLPTNTLSEINRSNHWCGYGRGRAAVFHRACGSPKKINARHILDALTHLKKRWDKRGFDRKDENIRRAIQAICRLTDQATAAQIKEEAKKLRRPGTYARWQRRYLTRNSWSNRRLRRHYPKVITHGHQLWALMDTFSPEDQILILDKALPNN